MTDIEIAQNARLKHINEIAAALGIDQQKLMHFGRYKAKVELAAGNQDKDMPMGKLVLVTAINPTPFGEGKTTVTVGLGQALRKIGVNAAIALREPSLGPVMGIKGGAAGGGYSQVLPMEDINLHFTGDFHAITAANNLLCAMLDNSLHHGNPLNIDVRSIAIRRVTDTNDRALRHVVVGLGGTIHGVPREDGFTITVASEVMAILCLAEGLKDLKQRLQRIIVAYNCDGDPVTCGDLQADGAMAMLLKDAILPNIVQTIEHTPAFIHGGPFANIAHGCNSIAATKLGLRCAEVLVTEAGFGADLGAEKFFDIKCPIAGITPDAVVIVATARALKYNGGADKTQLTSENLPALQKGLENLEKHIENMQEFGLEPIVALNSFSHDTAAEIDMIRDFTKNKGAPLAVAEVYSKGGEGGIALAKLVSAAVHKPSTFKPLYPMHLPIREKINTIATKIYGAKEVAYSKKAVKSIEKIEALGHGDLPVCMAKTQYSLSDDPSLLGRPRDFTLTVSGADLRLGAGFVVCYTGDVLTMPGLSKSPAAQRIDINDNGVITGLF